MFHRPVAAKDALLTFLNFLSSGTPESHHQCCELADPTSFHASLPALLHQPSTRAKCTWEGIQALKSAALPAQVEKNLQERLNGIYGSAFASSTAAGAVRDESSRRTDAEEASSGGASRDARSPPPHLWNDLEVEVRFEIMEADLVTEGLTTMCRFLLQVPATDQQ